MWYAKSSSHRLVAIIIAVPSIYTAMNNWLQGFAFRTSIDIETIILAGSLALIIATLTVTYQTSRAAAANPVDSLRSE